MRGRQRERQRSAPRRAGIWLGVLRPGRNGAAACADRVGGGWAGRQGSRAVWGGREVRKEKAAASGRVLPATGAGGAEHSWPGRHRLARPCCLAAAVNGAGAAIRLECHHAGLWEPGEGSRLGELGLADRRCLCSLSKACSRPSAGGRKCGGHAAQAGSAAAASKRPNSPLCTESFRMMPASAAAGWARRQTRTTSACRAAAPPPACAPPAPAPAPGGSSNQSQHAACRNRIPSRCGGIMITRRYALE